MYFFYCELARVPSPFKRVALTSQRRPSRPQNNVVGAKHLCLFSLNLTAPGFISYLLAFVLFGNSEQLISVHLLHATDGFIGSCRMSLQ